MTTLQVEREPAIAYLVEQTPAETLREVYEIVTSICCNTRLASGVTFWKSTGTI